MVIQHEYCNDIIKAIHTVIDSVSLFVYHICGHDRIIEYRLDVMNMSSGYGRSQRYMHPTNIEQEVRCLGLHGQIIEVGDDNNLLLQEGVDVPLCINTQDCVSTNFIQYD